MSNALFKMSTHADAGVLDVVPDIDRAEASATTTPTLASRCDASVLLERS
ncbi:MAG: hypothetical protein U5L04_07445 [Trueperaceae bacterium]|nr:hypothetical protein [Trueperaceae bacterium]